MYKPFRPSLHNQATQRLAATARASPPTSRTIRNRTLQTGRGSNSMNGTSTSRVDTRLSTRFDPVQEDADPIAIQFSWLAPLVEMGGLLPTELALCREDSALPQEEFRQLRPRGKRLQVFPDTDPFKIDVWDTPLGDDRLVLPPARPNPLGSEMIYAKSPGIVGLPNLGNTCWLNSLLQCAFALRDVLLSPLAAEAVDPIAAAFDNALRSVDYGIPPAVEDLEMLRGLMGPGSYQHDPHEFFFDLLSRIGNDFDTNVFLGSDGYSLSCLRCGNERNCGQNVYHSLTVQLPSGRTAVTTLEGCFGGSFNPEILSGNDVPHCPRCRMRHSASRNFTIGRLPRILVLRFNRHVYSGDGPRKNMVAVRFPTDALDLSRFVGAHAHGQAIYDLVAVINHHGSDTTSGHCTARTRNPRDGKWYEFDDDIVRQKDMGHMASPDVYMLFYRRR